MQDVFRCPELMQVRKIEPGLNWYWVSYQHIRYRAGSEFKLYYCSMQLTGPQEGYSTEFLPVEALEWVKKKCKEAVMREKGVSGDRITLQM